MQKVIQLPILKLVLQILQVQDYLLIQLMVKLLATQQMSIHLQQFHLQVEQQQEVKLLTEVLILLLILI